MKKHLRYLLTLLLVMVASVGWAQTYNTVAQFSSSEVVTGSGYKAYSNDDWSLSFGGNNVSVGTNKNNSGNCVITDNYGTGANTENNAVSIVSKNKISKVSQITFTYSGGNGNNSGKIYLAYSTDNVTWTAITLTKGEQGSNATTNMTFQFGEIASAYYAVILDKGSKASANWRWDNVNITFDELESTISTVSTPTFTPAAGTYNDAQNVEIETATDGATIYYTTDGSDPTTASNVYSVAIPVTTNMTIKAYAVKDGMTDSEIAEAAYVINYKVATPIFTPAAGTYNEAQNVTITTETDGATIYYTTDGTDPDKTSTEYTAAIPVAETMTIKAIAVKDGYTDSEIATAKYTIVDTGNWVFDELTYDLIEVSGTNYTTWSGKSTNSSSAVYAGNSAGGNESIQLRSTSNSGIVTTKSGGKAKQVVVIWNSNTASGRTLDVYGKNTAYSTAAELYSYDNKGEKLGSIAYGETTLTIEGDYEYIGVRSYSGAMYLDAVKIAWEPDTTAISVTIGETGYATLYYKNVNLTVPAGVTAKTYKANGTALVELDNYSAGDVIPAGTGVVLNGAKGDYTFAITTESGTANEENMLRGSDEAAETTGGAKYYMLSLAATGGNETVGFYYGEENGAAFTNGAHKAYLAVPEGTEAKAAGYAFNEVTGINDITREQVTDGVWYTIDGKRLNGEPTVKGIYVVNGKKVVIK